MLSFNFDGDTIFLWPGCYIHQLTNFKHAACFALGLIHSYLDSYVGWILTVESRKSLFSVTAPANPLGTRHTARPSSEQTPVRLRLDLRSGRGTWEGLVTSYTGLYAEMGYTSVRRQTTPELLPAVTETANGPALRRAADPWWLATPYGPSTCCTLTQACSIRFSADAGYSVHTYLYKAVPILIARMEASSSAAGTCQPGPEAAGRILHGTQP